MPRRCTQGSVEAQRTVPSRRSTQGNVDRRFPTPSVEDQTPGENPFDTSHNKVSRTKFTRKVLSTLPPVKCRGPIWEGDMLPQKRRGPRLGVNPKLGDFYPRNSLTESDRTNLHQHIGETNKH